MAGNRWGDMRDFLPKDAKPILKHLRITQEDDTWISQKAKEYHCSYAAILRGCIRLAREYEAKGDHD